MGKTKKDSKSEEKKEVQKEEVVLEVKQIEEVKSSQKTPQEILNKELIEHISFNEKVLNSLKDTLSRQTVTVETYQKKSSKVKSIPLLKHLVLQVRKIYEIKFKKSKEHTDELNILNKQTESNLKEIEKKEHTRENIVKFLKIPYKKEYQSKDIDDCLKIIEDKEKSVAQAKAAIVSYRKKIINAINKHHEKAKLNDFEYKYFKIEKEYDPSKILESKEMSDIQKQNEELIYASYKLLKTNVELTLLIDRKIESKEHSKLFVNFLKELKEKMDSAYEAIGQKELNKLLDELKEEQKIEETKKEIEKSEDVLEKTVEDEIEKGNKEIEKTLIDATPKSQKK